MQEDALSVAITLGMENAGTHSGAGSRICMSEITALQREHPGVCEDGSGRLRVQCDNAWFDGPCYHRDLREHP